MNTLVHKKAAMAFLARSMRSKEQHLQLYKLCSRHSRKDLRLRFEKAKKPPVKNAMNKNSLAICLERGLREDLAL